VLAVCRSGVVVVGRGSLASSIGRLSFWCSGGWAWVISFEHGHLGPWFKPFSADVSAELRHCTYLFWLCECWVADMAHMGIYGLFVVVDVIRQERTRCWGTTEEEIRVIRYTAKYKVCRFFEEVI
jgi:hypothetical protein